ncbi:MAG TPA: hypothetical protein VFY82_02715 [Acidimicrobiales bacterium]|nr:hypothetical protein [Acidimicrobiales bacterium]
MGGFFDAALGFPAVVFTVLLAPVLAYWLAVVLGALDIDLFGDLGVDGVDGVDVDGGLDVGDGVGAHGDAGGDGAGDAATDGGLLAGWWQALGLAGVPVTLAASLVVVFGWLVALVATAAADSWDVDPTVRLLAGLVVIAVALVAGSLGASVLARPLGRLFVTTEAESNQAFVGRTCTIRTAGVSTSFGQAEAADPSGATVLVQVRVPPDADGHASASFARGEQALIFDYDPAAEVFLVCPVEALEAGADGLS